MIDGRILECVARAADRFGLPNSLITALVIVESCGNPWAARHEPTFFDRYIKGRGYRVFGACSRDTEERLRATRFGLMQVMGHVAREHGFEQPFLTALCEPNIGLEYGCRQVLRMKSRYFDEHGWPGVVAAYDAGVARKAGNGLWLNQAYVNRVKKAGGFYGL